MTDKSCSENVARLAICIGIHFIKRVAHTGCRA